MLLQLYSSGVITCELIVVLPSWHCFRNPDALDPRLYLVRNVRQWLRKTLEELLQDTPLGSIAVSTAWQISRGPATSTAGVWDVICHTISRAEEVMRECYIHHTRSIKTNSAVNLSRKPGLDLCCDLLQHLQGVPRTSSFLVFTLSYVPVRWFCSSHHSNSLSYEM